MKAILDANFIRIPEKFKVDIYSQLKFEGFDDLIIPSPVLEEVEKLADKLSLELLKTQNFKVFDLDMPADKAVLEVAKKEKGAVCTQDKALKRLAKESNLRVVTLKNKSQLRID